MKWLEQRPFRGKHAQGPNGCILWCGSLKTNGYGQTRERRLGPHLYAHRLAYERAIGPIPRGMFVCHKCDVPNCINPEHLFLGGPNDNTQDMVRKGRQAFGERHGNAKLVRSQIVSIRADQRVHLEIANAYGVSRTLIGAIKRRRVWAHV